MSMSQKKGKDMPNDCRDLPVGQENVAVLPVGQENVAIVRSSEKRKEDQEER